MLRTVTALFSLAALAAPAFAVGPVSIAPISFGEELLDKADEYGERDLNRLAEFLRDDLERELGNQLGDGGDTLRVTIVDADPNRPTSNQMARGLHASSISIGGAEIEAQLVSSTGEVLETFEYAWHSHSISDVVGYGRWTDARRAFDRFASSVGDSVDAGAGS
jgi:hypothetical protein